MASRALPGALVAGPLPLVVLCREIVIASDAIACPALDCCLYAGMRYALSCPLLVNAPPFLYNPPGGLVEGCHLIRRCQP